MAEFPRNPSMQITEVMVKLSFGKIESLPLEDWFPNVLDEISELSDWLLLFPTRKSQIIV